ncbi:MAG TPA: 3-dehydroquinate synthase [Anaerolineales bacterium]
MGHIFLYGPPGSGKSTLGRMLADSLGLPFADLDQLVQSSTGLSIPQLMDQRGENGFRDAESSVLKEQLNRQESVIALGGGTLLREDNCRLVERYGEVFCLNAAPQVLLRRLEAESSSRPLLQGNTADKLASLLATRRPHYASFARQFDADAPPDLLIPRLQARIGRFHLTAMGSCDVVIQPASVGRLGELLRERAVMHPILVTDENVAPLYLERALDSLRHSGYGCNSVTIPAGETAKTLETVSLLWEGFLRAGLDRRSTVVALGGGVVGDLAGFAASTFLRGIDWICVPTSLLAMVDASLGGKTGFDLPTGKNLIGSFHAPRLVLSDPNVLRSLPEAEFRAGLAEVVKHGLVADPGLFEACAQGLSSVKERLPELIRRAAAVKIRKIEADPYERDQRAALNLGHTVGHALEVVSGFRIRHGEAVAMGMVAEAKLAERLGIAAEGLSTQIADALRILGLPVRIPDGLARGDLIHAMHTDKKKAGGVVRFTLPVEIGRVQLNVEVPELQLALEEV